MIFNSILIINYYDICIFMYKGRPTASCFSTKLGRRTSRSLHTRLASAGLLQVTRRQRSGVCPQLHHIQLWSKWMLKQQGPTPPGGYEDWWPKLKVNAGSTPSFIWALRFTLYGSTREDVTTQTSQPFTKDPFTLPKRGYMHLPKGHGLNMTR